MEVHAVYGGEHEPLPYRPNGACHRRPIGSGRTRAMPIDVGKDGMNRPARRSQRIANLIGSTSRAHRTASGFRERVWEILSHVPKGRVVTYGQLALLAGRPRAARQVGWIAHAGGGHLPWHRVVNRAGGLASGYQGGRAGHGRDLSREGVRFRKDLTIDVRRYQWWPDASVCAHLRLPDEVPPMVPEWKAAGRRSVARSHRRGRRKDRWARTPRLARGPGPG